MTEASLEHSLERVYEGEVIEDSEGAKLEDFISRWSVTAGKILTQKFEQALILADVHAWGGREAALAFGYRYGDFHKSRVYDYLLVAKKFGPHKDDEGFSERLDSGLLTMSLLVSCARTPRPMEALDEAEDENLSTRAVNARSREAREQEQIDEAQASGTTVETVSTVTCPRCSGVGAIVVEQ